MVRLSAVDPICALTRRGDLRGDVGGDVAGDLSSVVPTTRPPAVREIQKGPPTCGGDDTVTFIARTFTPGPAVTTPAHSHSYRSYLAPAATASALAALVGRRGA
jgi:hypothetical protein